MTAKQIKVDKKHRKSGNCCGVENQDGFGWMWWVVVGRQPYGLSERIEGLQLGNGRMVENEVQSKNNEGQAQETQ